MEHIAHKGDLISKTSETGVSLLFRFLTFFGVFKHDISFMCFDLRAIFLRFKEKCVTKHYNIILLTTYLNNMVLLACVSLLHCLYLGILNG